MFCQSAIVFAIEAAIGDSLICSLISPFSP
jgi:hypothetical protein